MLTFVDNKNPKKPKSFYCEKCNFKCSNKKDFNRHIMTAKHSRLTIVDGKSPKNPNMYICDCGKLYKSRQGLHQHVKKCILLQNATDATDATDEKDEKDEKNEEVNYKELLIQAMKQMAEQQKQITDMIPLIGNNNNSNNNNTNNKFNLNIFLNETCKDALNMNDFVDSLQLQINDLDQMNELGYVNGITRIILNGLNKLDLTKRPLHCSDVKREILYVKENNEWDKEESKTKLNNAITSVGKNTFRHFPEWMKSHPNCGNTDTADNIEYHSLIKNTLAQTTEENKNKIAKNIIKDVVIDK